MKDLGLEALSAITVYSKYAKYIPELQRRETWDEIVDRYRDMMVKKYPILKTTIDENIVFIKEKKVLPSMRALQFAGPAAEVNNSRIYNCFSRDTRFITSKGVKSFENFNHGDVTSVLTHKGNWKPAVVKSYGRQQLTEIEFVKGKSTKKVKATANHRWILKSGEETVSLKKGDIVYGAPDFISNFDWDNASVIERIAWCYGYVYGDGTRLKKNGEYKHSLVRLCGDQIKYLERFEEIGFESSSSMSLKGDIIVYTGKYLKTLPDIETCSFEELRAFVIGYLDADGAKVHGKTNKQLYRGIQSSNTESIKFIKDAFEVVSMYILNETDLTNQQTNYGTRPETSWFSMNHVIGTGPNNHWSVKSITPIQEEEEVWCLEVEDDHSFVLSGGIVTGNCCYLPIDSIYSFSETMFLLLGGTGVGYSVQKHHVAQLPSIKKPGKARNYLIEDSIMGWADAVKVLMKAYLEGAFMPKFDFRAIRHKGARLVTAGGKAPGPEPLKICIAHIQAILDRKQEGEQLSPIECHDILCHIANSVLSGGIRRSAMIALFSHDDEEMITCKYGNWWEMNEQRGRANNSAVLLRGEISEQEFKSLWKRIELSNSGEPGVYWTNNIEYGTNPYVEIALRPYQFCNLCEINADDIDSQEDLNERATIAAFFGTLQAGFTDFHYLRPIWSKTTQKDALLGIGMTGIASGKVLSLDLTQASEKAKMMNSFVSSTIGINEAARVTCIKPSGTTSLVLGTSSGIHAWHNNYYLRTMRFNKNEDIASYLMVNHPELCEDDQLRPTDTLCVRIPVKAPEGSILRTETAIDTLERVKKFSKEWIKPGHRNGDNSHNVSATISIDKNRLYTEGENEWVAVDEEDDLVYKVDEWEAVGQWMWDNQQFYNGLSVLPYWGGSFIQAPFEDITKEEYEKRMASVSSIDLTKVIELDDTVDFGAIAACAGGACSIE